MAYANNITHRAWRVEDGEHGLDGTQAESGLLEPGTAQLWCAGKEFVREETVGDRVGKKRALYENFLIEVALLESLSEYERSMVADALVSRSCDANQVILREGNKSDNLFYLVLEGEVSSSTGTSLKTGDYFGQMEILKGSANHAY